MSGCALEQVSGNDVADGDGQGEHEKAVERRHQIRDEGEGHVQGAADHQWTEIQDAAHADRHPTIRCDEQGVSRVPIPSIADQHSQDQRPEESDPHMDHRAVDERFRLLFGIAGAESLNDGCDHPDGDDNRPDQKRAIRDRPNQQGIIDKRSDQHEPTPREVIKRALADVRPRCGDHFGNDV